MRRVMVIGSCGAGKSTFSRRMADITRLNLIHLDQHYWKENWVESDQKEWETTMKGLVAPDTWIIDGNYGGTMDMRIQRADTIIYIDMPTWKCLWRVLKRIWTYRHRVRPDMPSGCEERLDFDFLHYVLTFNLLKRKYLHQKMQNLQNSKVIVILRTDQEIENYLFSLRSSTFSIQDV